MPQDSKALASKEVAVPTPIMATPATPSVLLKEVKSKVVFSVTVINPSLSTFNFFRFLV
jgi:hypothetical protein